MTMDSAGGLYRQWGRNASPLSSSPTINATTFTQIFGDKDCVVYLEFASTAGDTVLVEIGPDASDLIPIATLSVAATSNGVVTVVLPASWGISFTPGGDATLQLCTVITD